MHIILIYIIYRFLVRLFKSISSKFNYLCIDLLGYMILMNEIRKILITNYQCTTNQYGK